MQLKRLFRKILMLFPHLFKKYVLGIESPSREMMRVSKRVLKEFKKIDWDKICFEYQMNCAKKAFEALAAGEFGWEIHMMDAWNAMCYWPSIHRKMRPLDYYCEYKNK